MNKVFAGVGVMLMLSVGSVAGSAPAVADELSYLNTVSRMGVANDGNYVTILRWGYAVCADSDVGATRYHRQQPRVGS